MVSAREHLTYAVEEHDPRFPHVCDTLSLSPEDRVPDEAGNLVPVNLRLFLVMLKDTREKETIKNERRLSNSGRWVMDRNIVARH